MKSQEQLSMDLPLVKAITWDPKPDITTWELALCLQPLMLIVSGEQNLLSQYLMHVDPAIKRHFRVSYDTSPRN